jgi:LuxR family maltose regulon positive regulatory protein
VSSPILTTKLYIPPVRAGLVARPRLTALLDKSLAYPPSISLISAPPGFGKTTLLSEWIDRQGANDRHNGETQGRRRSTPAVAWVSLDGHDNDPVRFWLYVIAALEKIRAGVGTGALALLQSAQSISLEEALTTLINALALIQERFTLILDDYHVIDHPVIHQNLAFFLDHMPPQMHLIIASRTAPPLPLTRFRVRNQLIELRDSDLRFTPAEVATFLNQMMGLELSAADINALEARTEGWVAGLQLAALSLQGQDNHRRFVAAFAGSHRYVLDYLAEEVLAHQPEPIQKFLRQTSILERLHGPLCDWVLSLKRDSGAAPSTGQEILEVLEQANLFIIPLDDERRWYRYHHLFADFLAEQLSKTEGEAQIATLHRRASQWYAQNDFFADAISHSLLAQDIEQSVVLIEHLTMDLLTHGEAQSLLNWLKALPAETVRARPRLSLGLAWANLMLNWLNEIEPALLAAEASLAEAEREPATLPASDITGMRWEATAIRAMILANQNRVEESIALSEQVLAQIPADDLLRRSIIEANLGSAYALTGEFDKAATALADVVAMAQQVDNPIIVLTAGDSWANLELERGRPDKAGKIYQEIREMLEKDTPAPGQESRSGLLAGRVYMSLAEIFREQNDLAQATSYLDQGFDLVRRGGHLLGATLLGQIILARLRQAQGDSAGALAALETALQLPSGPTPLTLWAKAVRVRLWLAQDNISAAGQWLEQGDLPLDESANYIQWPGEYTTVVRVYLALEKFAEALALLDQLQAAESRQGRQGRLIEIVMLRALALYAQGEPALALPPLKEALHLAEAGGYIRLFVDEGPAMAALLAHVAKDQPASRSSYLNKLLAAFAGERPAQAPAKPRPGPPAANLIEPLSEREMEVLQLIAEGLSNQEIADRLVIAEGTVKKHIHNIFGKLDVRRRTQVVLRARELELL